MLERLSRNPIKTISANNAASKSDNIEEEIEAKTTIKHAYKYIVIVYICVCRVVVETVLNRIVSKKPNAFLLSFHRYWCCVLVDAIILVFVNSFFSLLVLSTLSYCLRPTQTFFHYDDHSPLGFFSFYFLFLFIFQSIIHSSMNKLADVDFTTVTTSTLK